MEEFEEEPFDAEKDPLRKLDDAVDKSLDEEVERAEGFVLEYELRELSAGKSPDEIAREGQELTDSYQEKGDIEQVPSHPTSTNPFDNLSTEEIDRRLDEARNRLRDIELGDILATDVVPDDLPQPNRYEHGPDLPLDPPQD